MGRIVITHTVENVANWKQFDDERAANIGAFGTDIQSYVDPNGSNAVAISMNVTDLDGLKTFMQSEICGSIMSKHGVIKPVTTYCSES